ncbi:MAG: response regulator [Pseudomonadota bacterium]
MHTLILEDDDLYRAHLQIALQGAGFEVVAAAGLQDALDALLHNDFKLLLLDLVIAGQQSLSVARAAAYNCPLAEVILLTGTGLYPQGEYTTACPNISWCLRKPAPMADVLAVAEHCRRRIEPLH